jgi:hypothetical protein
MMKMPPKPQQNPNNSNNNINYRLPPRPMYPGMQPPNPNNKSYDIDTARQR